MVTGAGHHPLCRVPAAWFCASSRAAIAAPSEATYSTAVRVSAAIAGWRDSCTAAVSASPVSVPIATDVPMPRLRIRLAQ